VKKHHDGKEHEKGGMSKKEHGHLGKHKLGKEHKLEGPKGKMKY